MTGILASPRDTSRDLAAELDQMRADRVAAAVARRTRTANTRAAFAQRRTAGKTRHHADRLANTKETPMPVNGSTVKTAEAAPERKPRCRYLIRSGRPSSGLELTRCPNELAGNVGDEVELCVRHLAAAIALVQRRASSN
jgi:hypothetical protein